jgi:hypothetical protein
VNNLVKIGKIPLVDGKIDPAVADAAWEQNRDSRLSSKLAGEEGRPWKVPGVRAAPRSTPDDRLAPPPGSLAAVTLRLQSAKAMEADLNAKKLEGALIEKAYVMRELGGMIRNASSRAQAAAHKLAPQVAAETETVVCFNLMQEEFHQILRGLSEWTPKEAA